MTLRKQVPCPRCGGKKLPTPADETVQHMFECPRCGRRSVWSPPYSYPVRETYGFLGLRSRQVTRTQPGGWYRVRNGRRMYEEVTR